MTTTNLGRDIIVYNPSIVAGSDTLITLAVDNPQTNCVTIQCRTAVDLQIRKANNDANYFTIKSGTVFQMPISTLNTTPFYLRSASGTVVAEIIVYTE